MGVMCRFSCRRRDPLTRSLQCINIPSGFLALSQRLSPLGLIFRSPTPTSGNIILVNFRISLLKYIKLINYYSRHYALFKIALIISFDYKLLEL
jgi:hypothetical protein